VLTALSRRNQRHVPGADVEHFGLQGPVGCASRALLMEAVDFCVATSAVTDSVTASPAERIKRREHRRADVTWRSRGRAMTSPRPHSSHQPHTVMLPLADHPPTLPS
jgi:hypothetical protein